MMLGKIIKTSTMEGISVGMRITRSGPTECEAPRSRMLRRLAMSFLSLLLPATAPAFAPQPADARTLKSGQVVRYTARIRLPCRDAQVYRITKRWAAKGNVIRSVHNIVGGNWVQSSSSQRGVFSYPVRHAPGIRNYATRIFFRTVPGRRGRIATAITFHIRSRTCGRRLLTKRSSVTIRP